MIEQIFLFSGLTNTNTVAAAAQQSAYGAGKLNAASIVMRNAAEDCVVSNFEHLSCSVSV